MASIAAKEQAQTAQADKTAEAGKVAFTQGLLLRQEVRRSVGARIRALGNRAY